MTHHTSFFEQQRRMIETLCGDVDWLDGLLERLRRKYRGTFVPVAEFQRRLNAAIPPQ